MSPIGHGAGLQDTATRMATGYLIRTTRCCLPPGMPVRFEIAKPPAAFDGIPGEAPAAAVSSRSFNFCGAESRPLDGFRHDHGRPFDGERGFGWNRDMSANHRRRNLLTGARDTFLFTRDAARWECAVPDGRWQVTVCVGDAGFEQSGQRVRVEGVAAVSDATTAPGWFLGDIGHHRCPRRAPDGGAGARRSQDTTRA